MLKRQEVFRKQKILRVRFVISKVRFWKLIIFDLLILILRKALKKKPYPIFSGRSLTIFKFALFNFFHFFFFLIWILARRLAPLRRNFGRLAFKLWFLRCETNFLFFCQIFKMFSYIFVSFYSFISRKKVFLTLLLHYRSFA